MNSVGETSAPVLVAVRVHLWVLWSLPLCLLALGRPVLPVPHVVGWGHEMSLVSRL